MGSDVGDLLHELAVAEDVIARDVGADIEVLGQGRQARIAGVGAGNQRAGPRVALAVEQEVLGEGARKNADVGLHVAGRDAGGVAG